MDDIILSKILKTIYSVEISAILTNDILFVFDDEIFTHCSELPDTFRTLQKKIKQHITIFSHPAAMSDGSKTI